MTKSKGFSDHDATVATIIGNCVRDLVQYRVESFSDLRSTGSNRVSNAFSKCIESSHLLIYNAAEAPLQAGSASTSAVALLLCTFFILNAPRNAHSLFGSRSIFVCLIAAFIPLWILPSSFGALAAGAFCIQFGVQGAWGVVSLDPYWSLLEDTDARGTDPYPTRGDVATCFPCNIPRRCLPGWKRKFNARQGIHASR